jgi:hypothetical protein
MMELPYSRLLNRPVRYLKFFSVGDLFFLVIVGLLGTAFLGFGAAMLFGAVYFVHLLVFRIGKRPGYDVHFFKSLVRPDRYRVGGTARRARVVLRSLA